MNKSWLAVPFIGVALIAVALSVFETDVLYRVQEQSLFLHTPLYFRQCMVTSGGLLSWMGTFLTQFFYYPVWGVMLLCLCWAALVALLLVVFRIPARWAVVALIPVVLLLIANVDLGYWIFYLKLRGYYFVATLGTLVAVALTGCYRWLAAHGSSLSIAFLIVSVAVGYPLFGFYALLAAVMMAVVSWRIMQKRSMALATSSIAGVFVIDVPIVYYHTFFHETNIVNIWWTALPVFRYNEVNCPAYNIPYVLLVVSLLLMSAFYRPTRDPGSQGDRYVTTSEDAVRIPVPLTATVLLMVALVAATIVFWNKDSNFRLEQSMSRAISQLQWERVVTLSADADNPTRDICMMRNLALFRLGRQGDEMYHYPDGNCEPRAPFPVRIVHTDGKMLYMNYGLVNFCYRWCIEDGVKYGWDVATLHSLVKCSLLTGEKAAARKFISLLRKTMFCQDACARYENLLRNPRQMLNDPELAPILMMQKNDDDYLSSDNADIEQFLLNHFVSARSSNPVYQEQSLLAALQMRNPQLFWMQFYQYTELHPGEQVPVHYQEAACLFGRLSDQVDTSHMPFDKEVVRRCDEFMAVMDKRQGQSDDAMAAALYDRFHDTYFYHYFFKE